MKAGKALNERKTEVRVQFKPPAVQFLGDPDSMRNELVVRTQLLSCSFWLCYRRGAGAIRNGYTCWVTS